MENRALVAPIAAPIADADAAAMWLPPWLYQLAIFMSNSLLDEPALLALIFT